MDKPRHGRIGTAVQVNVNAFKVSWDAPKVLHHYDGARSGFPSTSITIAILMVDGEVIKEKEPRRPNEDSVISQRKGMEIMDRLQSRMRPDIFQPRVPFDGKKNLWSKHKLELHGGGNIEQFLVPWTEGDEDQLRPRRDGRPPAQAIVIINWAATVTLRYSVSELQGLLQGSGAPRPEALTAIGALNVLVRAQPMKSVRPSLGGIIINVDIATGLMIREIPLTQLCLEYLGLANPSRLCNLTDQEFQKIRHFLKGIFVVIKVKPNRRSYRIQDVVKHAGRVVFEKGDQKLTVEQHFRKAHRENINPDMIGVKIGSTAIFPLSVCHAAPGQMFKKQPPQQVKDDMIKFSKHPPAIRARMIMEGWDSLEYGRSDYLRSYGVSVSPSMLDVKARILPAPRIILGKAAGPGPGGPSVFNASQRNPGVWNMTGHEFLIPKPFLGPLAVIDWSHEREDTVRGWANELVNVMRSLGMVRPDPKIVIGVGNQDVEGSIKHIAGQCRAQLTLAILPKNALDIYIRVKRFGDIQKGVVTQCMRVIPRKRYNDQYWRNLCLKINVKLGGVNLQADDLHLREFQRIPSMIIGADVTHPDTPARPSIASMVSSYDNNATKYVASMSVQRPREEVIANIGTMLERALTCFEEANSNKEAGIKIVPMRLIIYRDGVSEGEYQYEQDGIGNEIRAIEEVLNTKRLEERPRLTYIVVGKRHHVRFFPQPNSVEQNGNCLAGLVVDDRITHPSDMDFYVQSQSSLPGGTSRPSHYVVVKDENNFSIDFLQSLSYLLCYNYARATRSVSIPAPVYYADLVCRRAKLHFPPEMQYWEEGSVNSQGGFDLQFFQSKFNKVAENMKNTMYFFGIHVMKLPTSQFDLTIAKACAATSRSPSKDNFKTASSASKKRESKLSFSI
ncbi:hypothetical protein JAAARDRAFT_45615 [Jaapia argillacea MUCL 33604]|uniref:Piwi domain-containing protein n=1 Tax=Jaapia argillacea MUCL 33604 TaxID=933084 RepID=A0A067Q412_9AGAM|nr:hypothetical protein JAAARDRAFT_45615 [Jaapia argillacea MUCL 33604]